jgi:hypothetical protein
MVWEYDDIDFGAAGCNGDVSEGCMKAFSVA